MSDEIEIKPIGLLYMWLLVTRGGEACLKDIRPECKPEYRRPLIAKGLVAETPEGRTKRLTLTDAGWHYLATHMTSSIKTMSAATSSSVLQGILASLRRHLGEKDFCLAEIFSPSSSPPADSAGMADGTAIATEGELWHRLYTAWNRLQDTDEGIRLEKLRSAFPELARERLDQALLDWQKQGRIVIYPYDDGERITPEVREAALRVNDRDLHIVYQK
jgi:hypothetical protein